jgi:hypothetical protein
MHLYTFHLFSSAQASTTFDATSHADDGAAFEHAGRLLDRHPSCNHVEVWRGERSVIARHRVQPIIRPVASAA